VVYWANGMHIAICIPFSVSLKVRRPSLSRLLADDLNEHLTATVYSNNSTHICKAPYGCSFSYLQVQYSDTRQLSPVS